VGWVGADGNGEWAVALRSAQFDATGRVTAYAGAGIVAESVPERELLETRMKFRPIAEALD
ncbi:MAG: chorismate-binding protein, partial [Microbacteriaceae bacterium]|nr:chorismate-binding protein [Microbacteriaceae bacterium]